MGVCCGVRSDEEVPKLLQKTKKPTASQSFRFVYTTQTLDHRYINIHIYIQTDEKPIIMDPAASQQRSSTGERVCALILSFFLPPLGVLLLRGCGVDFLINVLLTLLLPWCVFDAVVLCRGGDACACREGVLCRRFYFAAACGQRNPHPSSNCHTNTKPNPTPSKIKVWRHAARRLDCRARR
jgi:uncharacterized membrane protein YqaE (UPF0057 family)